MSTPSVPKEIRDLQRRWAQRGSLEAAEIQKLADWAAQSVETQVRTAEEEAAVRAVGPNDLVEFTMPATVLGNAYSINGMPYQGYCRVPFGVYTELARMYEQDRIGDIELRSQRGSKEFGLKMEKDGFAIAPIPFRLAPKETNRAA